MTQDSLIYIVVSDQQEATQGMMVTNHLLDGYRIVMSNATAKAIHYVLSKEAPQNPALTFDKMKEK